MFRRIVILFTGTIAGLVAVVSYHPPQLKAVTTIGTAPATTASAPTSTTGTVTTTTTTNPGNSTGTKTVVGDVAQTQWGPVQVQITVSGGKITAVQALQFPNSARRSLSISQQAIPYLIQQTISTSSANVVGVSGASYTSDGWRRSLQSARTKAGI
jgi:uncharacterized protein with FMN-binding domain